MPLVDLWKVSPDQITGKTVQQLLAFAGDGRLRDASQTSSEFRDFLGHIPSDLLVKFADYCLSASFADGGFALQDIVNQIGRRLGFQVTDGRYRGVAGQVGFDGVWRANDGGAILIEVKTTDAYRLSLETTAEYRRALIKEGSIPEETSSILYVVGRSDTGDLEAQVRGSRHAWDIRLISVDALFRILKIKEELDDQDTINRIRAILTPQEFTRVDGIIDLVFNATKEVAQEKIEEPEDGAEERPEKKFTPVHFRDGCIERLQMYLGESLVKQTAAIYATPDHTTAVLCAISREYQNRNQIYGYWFAFHPTQKTTLEGFQKALVALGCGSESRILAIPFETFALWLPMLNRTELEDRFYWHVRITRINDAYQLDTKRGHEDVNLSKFLIPSGSRG
jgi:hypothetical protein